MSEPLSDLIVVRGRVDAAGRLVEADPPLESLHERAGGEPRGALAVPQIASVARLARRLGILIARPIIAADGEADLDLWVRAQPNGGEVELAISGWMLRKSGGPAEAAEAEREADFLRASADWMWESDTGLRLTSYSPAAAAALGGARTLMGKPLTRLFSLLPDADGSLPILNALAEQRRFDSQLAELRGRGRTRFVLSGVPLRDASGRFSGFHGSARSLPRESVAESPAPGDAVDQVDPGAFGARLEKALRAPLDEIIAHADSIGAQPEGPLRRDYAGYARDIAAAGRHLLALVEDLVDLQAIERPDFAPRIEAIDLGDIARRASGLLAVRASARGVRVEVPAGGSLRARGEERRVLQILVNLISNAVRYSPEGGIVSVDLATNGDFASITIRDQGKGIAAEDQARIFEKFERLDSSEQGGTGLGLYIARRLAIAMGGELSVASTAGEGARFTLALSLSDA